MTGANTGFAFAVVSAFIWRQTSGGIAVGQLDPDSLTPATTSHAYRLPGFVSATKPQPTYERATEYGDQTVRGQNDMGASDFGSFEINVSSESATLRALVGDSLVDTTTLSNAFISSENQGQVTPPTFGVMYTRQFTSRDTATAGTVMYETTIYPKVQIRYVGGGASQDSGTNPNPVVLQCTPTKGGKFPGGNAFSSTQGWASNETISYSISAAKPFALTAYVQDGVTTTYTLGYLPSTSVVTATDHIFTVNGTVTAPTSVSTSTAVVTLAAAGTSGQVDVALYQVSGTDFATP